MPSPVAKASTRPGRKAPLGLYFLERDEREWYVEASSVSDAVARWRRAAGPRRPEPTSVTRLSAEPVIR